MLGGLSILNESQAADMIQYPPSAASDESLSDDAKKEVITEIEYEVESYEAESEAEDENPELREDDGIAHVAIVKTTNREDGIARAAELLGKIDFSGKDVYLKGSYNSPDAFPATTHPYALGAMVRMLRGKGAGKVTFIERSGMGRTRDVLEKLNVLTALDKLNVPFRLLDELSADEWCYIAPGRSHWPKGIEFPKFLMDENKCVVQLCNLKTHRFGGRFSASLKNSIGLIAKYATAPESGLTEKDANGRSRGWNYMKDLHSSSRQGQMIAEANQTYTPELIVMDAIEVFISGGPEKGETAATGIIAASRDRVAIDAVGFAILQHAGAHMTGAANIFGQPQIMRAVELNLGVRSPGKIRIVSDDTAGRLLAERLEDMLTQRPSRKPQR